MRDNYLFERICRECDKWELKEKGLVKVLILNSVRCLVCNEVLVSKSQHHFVMCNCENQTMTDGGNL